jgi:hypothetical protein
LSFRSAVDPLGCEYNPLGKMADAENGTQTVEELESNLREYRTQLKQVGSC